MKSQREVVDHLNEMLRADPVGMAKIFMSRIAVSAVHTPHEDIVTAPIGGVLHYGPLGIINALLGEGRVVMVCARDDPFMVPVFFHTEEEFNEIQAASQQCCRDNPEGNACGDDCSPGESLDNRSFDRPG